MRKICLVLLLALFTVGCGSKKSDDCDDALSVVEESKSDASLLIITEEEALEAIKQRCLSENPNLEEMMESEDYTIYFNVETNSDGKIVVSYRSYTGAIIRYYIEPESGDTYVTEFVQGITDNEEPTGETFNLKDYIKEN